MKAVAVICEYNPFHNGHICLLDGIKKAFPEHAVISVMSGNTVQRGDFAVQNKYVRAKNALLNGSDLVLELPFPFSVSAAEQFARAGVFISRAVGAEILAFGSESGDLQGLKETAKRLSSEAFESELRKAAREAQDEPFIALRDRVYRSIYGVSLPSAGNDILGVEYLKNTEKLGGIAPYVIHRTTPLSATAARKAIFYDDKAETKRLLPDNREEGEIHKGLRGLYALVIGYLRLTPSKDSGNGLRNAIKQAAERTENYDDFINALPTKGYTLARLRREVISMLLDVSEEDKNAVPQYTVLLGATEKGLRYLSERKKEILVPVLTKKSDSKALTEEGLYQLSKAERCDGIYALGLKKDTGAYFKTPVICK